MTMPIVSASVVVRIALDHENRESRWRLTPAERDSEIARISALVGEPPLDDRGALTEPAWIDRVSAAVRLIGPRVALERLTFRRPATTAHLPSFGGGPLSRPPEPVYGKRYTWVEDKANCMKIGPDRMDAHLDATARGLERLTQPT